MTYFYKVEIYSSFLGAALSLVDNAADGWLINPDDLPDVVGFNYRVSLRRETEPRVVMTRAEILVKARAARKVKETTVTEGA